MFEYPIRYTVRARCFVDVETTDGALNLDGDCLKWAYLGVRKRMLAA